MGTGIDGRVALVTGAGHGIGRGIAYALARDGARVVVNWSRDEAAAEHTVGRITDAGGEAEAVKADVSARSTSATSWYAAPRTRSDRWRS